MDTYLGLDLGGTKLLIGEVDAEGNVLGAQRYATGQVSQQEAVRIIRQSLDDYISRTGWHDAMKRPVAMGVDLVGRIDNEHGIWHQIDAGRTEPMPLAQELERTYGMPCRLDNDVKAATRAEARWGCGRQSRDFIYINVGTGLAAGIVTGGQLVRGGHFNAGEVGHTTVGGMMPVGVRCVCGREDCVELLTAGVGFDRCARLLANRYETQLDIPQDGTPVSVKDVFALARQNDPLCEVLTDNAAKALAGLMMNLVRVTDPDTIVLGGSIVADGYLLGRTEQYLQAHTMRFVTGGVRITQLNPQYIGLLGAAAVAMGEI